MLYDLYVSKKIIISFLWVLLFWLLPDENITTRWNSVYYWMLIAYK